MKKITFLFFFLNYSLIFGQKSDFGNWLVYIGNKQVNPQWNWHSEVQYRNYNAIGDLEQLLIRTGVGYNLSEKNNNILLGYAFVHSENYSADSVEKNGFQEHRIYQQFLTKQDFGRVELQHRYRIEQRFFEDAFSMRFRYSLAMKIYLNNKELLDNTFYISFYNELFVRNTKHSVFDRNRLYGGIGYKLNKNLRFELGYMNQFLPISERDQLNILAYLNF